jgi:hypothetical protein
MEHMNTNQRIIKELVTLIGHFETAISDCCDESDLAKIESAYELIDDLRAAVA